MSAQARDALLAAALGGSTEDWSFFLRLAEATGALGLAADCAPDLLARAARNPRPSAVPALLGSGLGATLSASALSEALLTVVEGWGHQPAVAAKALLQHGAQLSFQHLEAVVGLLNASSCTQSAPVRVSELLEAMLRQGQPAFLGQASTRSAPASPNSCLFFHLVNWAEDHHDRVRKLSACPASGYLGPR